MNKQNSMTINFEKGSGLIPAVIQDFLNGEVLMLGFMNQQALDKTISSGFVHFWSRSRNSLWMKGETSGNKLKVDGVFIDCDKDTVLIEVEVTGPSVCHKGTKSCFRPMHK
jgi:phosphoribosyl-AMP cyclohydrolase